MFEALRQDLKRYHDVAEGSELSNQMPAWVRLLVRALFRVEIHAIIAYRYGHWAYYMDLPESGPLRLPARLWRLAHLALHFVLAKIGLTISGINLPAPAWIEPGIFFPHPGPIFIHGQVVIGRNVTIYPGVVVGGDHSHDGAPRLGDNVVLGAGCKVLGPITVGSNVLVGANAVVVKDVPDEAVAVGVPAVVKKRIWTEKHADGSYELPSDEPPAAHGSPVVVQLDALPPDDVGESAR